MEKKNTILLTVIAIATLLVAVVGATFAYFTAQVTTNNDDKNNVDVTTAALATATMDLGPQVTAEDIYPGAKVVKPIHVTGGCREGATTCTPINTDITITPDFTNAMVDGKNVFVGESGASDITWKLYKSDQPITCRNVIEHATQTPDSTTTPNSTTTEIRYTQKSTCKLGTVTDATTDEEFAALTDVDFDSMTALISGDVSKLSEMITVYGSADKKTDDYYYLVVSYADNGNQDAQQDKNFKISISFGASTTVNTDRNYGSTTTEP